MAVSFESARIATAGRWAEILVALGIPPDALTRRHGPCPGCGGRDRFRFDDKDGAGTWICGGGGELRAGDGFDLLCHVNGWNRSDALQAVADYLRLDSMPVSPAAIRPPTPPREVPRPSPTQGYAIALWAAVNREDRIVASHPYAQRKGIEWAGGAGRVLATGSLIGRDADCIVVPIREHGDGRVQGVQCINLDGAKQSFGAVRDGYLMIGSTLDKSPSWYVAEGWASAFSVVAHHGKACCAVAFGKANLERVAHLIADDHGPSRIVVLVEDDQ